MVGTFEYFLRNYRLFYQTDGVEIVYGEKLDVGIEIKRCVPENFWSGNKDIEFDKVVWRIYDGVRIPFLFEDDNLDSFFSITDKKVTINFDIVSSTFYFLSGWNEKVSGNRDEIGRISYKEGIIHQLGISGIPVVNYYFKILNSAIEEYKGGSGKLPLWNGGKFAVVISHDIDACLSGWLEGSKSELKKLNFFSIPKLIFKRFFQQDVWFNFKKIINIVQNYKGTSTFYFMVEKGKIGKFKNADYKISREDIRREIKHLIETGNEIGIHGSFGTNVSSDMLSAEIKKLNLGKIDGNRFHFLMFDPIKTPSILESSGIKYDSTLGFAETIGFRRGTCFPFYLYDFQNQSISNVLEIPLMVMDASLSGQKYMNLNPTSAFSAIKPIIDEVHKFEGVFTILWHNTFFSKYKYTGWSAVLEETLTYINSKNPNYYQGKDIYKALTGNQ